MVRNLLTCLSILALLPACEEYDPPPELESTNLAKGLYEPSQPLEIHFSEPVVESTLSAVLRLDRRDPERELCLEARDGCTELAEQVFTFDDAEVTLSEDRLTLVFDAGATVKPFGRYVVVIDEGLEDDDGRPRGAPIEVNFQVAGAFEPSATDFETGMFLAILSVVQPIPTTLPIYFWLEVDPDTGVFEIWGADADELEGVDAAVSRDPAGFIANPNPPEGFSVRGRGQVADSEEGTVMVVAPFDIVVQQPPVTVFGAEFTATLSRKEVTDLPGERDVLEGNLFSPRVTLGLTDPPSELGEGNGGMELIRLGEGEGPTLEEILADGFTVEDVRASIEQ